MAKIILCFAIAVFAVMTVFASAAEACVSCEHVPVVARGSQTSNSAKRDTKKSVYKSTKKRKARAAKKHTVRRKTTSKKRVVKRKTTAKKTETVKAAPIKSGTDNHNSTISTASLDNSYAACNTNGKTPSVGCIVARAAPSKTAENVGCKKFLPTVGITVTVPCE